MSNLSELLPAGGGVNNTDFTASGAIASGKPVILNSNGTVTQVATSTTSQAFPISGTSFVDWWDDSYTKNSTSNSYADDFSVHPSDSTKAVIGSRENAKGVCTVLTRSNNTISAGDFVEFESSNYAHYVKVACGKVANQFVVYYKDGATGYFKCRVGTISGSTCSFGTETNVFSGNYVYNFLAADPSTDNKYIFGYKNSSSYPTCKVGTVDGTGITFGSEVSFTTYSGPEHTDCCFDPATAGKFAVMTLSGSGDAPLIIQTTYSGTTVSGTHTYTLCNDDSGKDLRGSYDASSGDLVVSYRDRGSPYYGCVRVIEADGTRNAKVNTSSAALTGQGIQCTDVSADPDNTTRFCTIYAKTSGGNQIYARSFVTSGNSGSKTSTLDTEVELGSSNYDTYGNVAVNYWGSDGKICMSYNSTTSDVNHVFMGQGAGASVSNLTSSNLIGVASAAISNSASGTINTWGSMNEAQSSLSINSDYYVQGDGTISTTSTSPAQLLGKAINATTINIKDYTG